MSSGLAAVRKAAQAEKGRKFTALLHHLTPELLASSCYALKRNAAPGVNGVTWTEFGADLEDNVRRLHTEIHTGTYRARPARRICLPKTAVNAPSAFNVWRTRSHNMRWQPS